jgi:hypothetical protein
MWDSICKRKRGQNGEKKRYKNVQNQYSISVRGWGREKSKNTNIVQGLSKRTIPCT